MQRPLSLLLSLCLVVALVVTSCRKDEDNPVKPGTNQPTVATTIAGVVTSENGDVMQGITVQAHGKTATTNQNGLFVIKDVRVPQNRCFVLAHKNGYFTASRAEVPKVGGVTHMRLSMMSNAPQYSVSASAGGKVTLSEGGSIEFPANGYVLSNGQSYTGTVKVAARWLNPVSSAFYSFFPGDFTAQRTDASETELYSYGVLNVELSTPTGDKVQLGNGKKALLTYPLPSSMQSGAPSEMPLWYFDEELGMWKEDGKAVRQGSVYTGEVSHFTPWNCDIPIQTGFLRGRVECGGAAVSGIWVKVGQREVITDENGEYSARVPAGMVFEVSVEANKNLGSGTASPVQVGPVAAQQTITQNLVVSPCPAYITGTLVDCNGNPTEGIVQAVGTASYNAGYAVVQNGTFIMRVEADVMLSVEALGYNGGVSEPLSVQPVTSGTTYNIGTVELCPQTAITFTDIDDNSLQDIYGAIALSPDGGLLAVTKYPNITIYDAQSGTLVQTLSVSSAQRIAFSADGSRLLTSPSFDSTGTNPTRLWNTSTWQEERSFPNVGGAIFTPDGNSILGVLGATSNNIVVQYSVATGAEIGRYTPDAGYWLTLGGITASGTEFIYRTYASGTQRAIIAVWNMSTNSLAREIELPDRAYEGYLAKDGSTLVVPSWDKVYLYNLATGQEISSLSIPAKENSRGFALAPNGTDCVFHAYPGPVGLYNALNSNRIRLLPSPANQDARFSIFDYSADGMHLAGVWTENRANMHIRIWHLP